MEDMEKYFRQKLIFEKIDFLSLFVLLQIIKLLSQHLFIFFIFF